ncbi:MAG: hypothetical protein EA352_05170 [Gemmatimonadales bacterium]|nr:MAG: hypothetical protein EA352_05170 [Gemmatimonadales bacterium]
MGGTGRGKIAAGGSAAQPGPLGRGVDGVWGWLERRWERWVESGGYGGSLVVVFVGALLLVEAGRLGWLPEGVAAIVPESRFFAINAAFTAFLVLEVIGLAFGLVDSVARAAGKQLEIFSLILLRKSFTELQEFDTPIAWESIEGPVAHILADAFGALFIFGIVGWYYAMQRHRPIVDSEDEQEEFIRSKKAVAILLQTGILAIALFGVHQLVTEREVISFFNAVFTLFIFTDVLMVLVSLQFNPDYRILFRNSGFAVSTVLIRLALAGPPFLNAALGVLAALFAVGVTWVYNRFAPHLEDAPEFSRRPDRRERPDRPGGSGGPAR